MEKRDRWREREKEWNNKTDGHKEREIGKERQMDRKIERLGKRDRWRKRETDG